MSQDKIKNQNETKTDEISARKPVTPNKENDNQLPQSIEEWEKIQNDNFENSAWDNRKIPEYDISYRQKVTTEDVFFQVI